MEELQSQIINALVVIVGLVVSWGVAKVQTYIKAHVENDYVQGLMLRLATAAEAGVLNVSGTLVPRIREASADGRITPEEAEELRATAKVAVLGQLTQLDRKKLEELFDRDQLELKLDTLIEAAVQRLKEGAK